MSPEDREYAREEMAWSARSEAALFEDEWKPSLEEEAWLRGTTAEERAQARGSSGIDWTKDDRAEVA